MKSGCGTRKTRTARSPPGEIGEIGGRGACLMLGYFDNQQATEESFNRDGWFMSGDLGRLRRARAVSKSSAARRT